VGPYSDLEQRLNDIPPSARARGIWVRNFENVLAREGKLGQYVAIVGEPAAALGWHPLGEVVARLAVAAAVHTSPREMHVGLRALGRAQAVQFSHSLLGKTLIRLLNPDPVRVLQQGAAARRQTCNYGSWEYDFSQTHRVRVTHRDEYGWLDTQVLGSAEGTFDAIKVPAQFHLEMVDRYNGVIDITW
jgi:uncharacterized protein (TIGR02265 family)